MKALPKAPKFSISLIGPGIVLIAMGLGSGEFILWPSLVAQFGFGVLLGAVLGIVMQYFVSLEATRYTLATGGTIYEAFYRLNKFLPIWFILSTFASFAWPAIILSAGTILASMLDLSSAKTPTIILLLIIGVLLTFGGKVYDTLEKFQKLILILVIPVFIAILALTFDADIPAKLSTGLLGFGDGYWFFPTGASLIGFLGAIAYTGAAGNLILSQSLYVQDEGLGAAKYSDSQIDLYSDKEIKPSQNLVNTKEDIHEFYKWFRLVSIEQFISFVLVGLVSIIILVVIAYSLVYPFNGNTHGLDFIFLQAKNIEALSSHFISSLFLISGVVFLFSTQLGIFETTSRVMTENIQLLKLSSIQNIKRKYLFYTFLWLQIIAAIFITLLDVQEPVALLITATFFSAVSIFVLTGLLLWLNSSEILKKEIRIGMIRKLILLTTFIFYGIFVLLTVFLEIL